MLPDDQVRTMVREAIARHAGVRTDAPRTAAEPPPCLTVDRRHASHMLLPVAPGNSGDGTCFIEPSVACNHCGYCQSYGH